LTIGLLGLILELYTPGFGVSGIIGVCCLILFFFGHMVVDLAGWGHIILFAVGVILLGVEIFVTPGFGVLGIGGIVLVVISLVLALMGVKDLPSFKLAWDLGYATRAMAVVFGAIAVTAILAYLAVKYLPGMKFLSGLVLKVSKDSAAGEAAMTTAEIGRVDVKVGDRGVALTVLRPAGKVRFGDQRVSVVAQGKSIPKGSEVEVIRKELGTVVVRKV
jgi:membrane-bound serine protease (ClpP class)